MAGSIVQSNNLTGKVSTHGILQATVEPRRVLKGIVSKAKTDNEKVFILKDDYGNEFVGVLTDTKPVFSATSNDIRIGMTALTEEGVTVGEKVIPGYLAHQGVKIIKPGSKFEIYLPDVNQYDYTLLQCMICDFNTNVNDSVATNTVVIGDSVYKALSTDQVAIVLRNHDTRSIELGIINETDKPQILRYFTYKEID